jgi:hypothetical protein
MRVRTWMFRSVWVSAVFGSLLTGCGGEPGVNEGSEPGVSHEAQAPSEGEITFTALLADELAGADGASGRPPDELTHSAFANCPGSTVTWSTWRPSWNNNVNTQGTYVCQANVASAPPGTNVFLQPANAGRSGSAQLSCNNGTWQSSSYSCDGQIVDTSVVSGYSTVCSHWEPVRSMWIGWFLADLKRCADPSGLEWWVSQYNNNAGCPSYNNYDGYGSKDACWRAHFRNGANANGNSYTDAQTYGHISAWDENHFCGPYAAYPWTNVVTNGTKCKYRP